MWNLKINDTNELTKQKRFKDLEKELIVAVGEGIVRNFGKVMNTLLYLKWITNRDLLCSTWNCPMLCTSLMGGWLGGESVQFSSAAQSCLTLWFHGCSTPGFPVHHQLLDFSQTHVHRVGDAIQSISFSFVSFSCLQSLSASGSLLMSQFFASDGQSVGVSASA